MNETLPDFARNTELELVREALARWNLEYLIASHPEFDAVEAIARVRGWSPPERGEELIVQFGSKCYRIIRTE